MGYVEPLMRQNFLEYASYVIMDRAIPDLRDGCKPVQRRLLTTLFDIDDGRFHKLANVIGETMKLHPHGDASIGDALVVLANKEYFIERQGNFGNLLTGHPPAAPRYIECRLTALAKETLFNKKLTEYQPSYDGRKQEPVFLPAKLPVVLMLGTEGIAVGMSTRILPHNFCELIQAQIQILRSEPIALFPDFPQGGLMDAEEYEDGRGKVRVRARFEVSRDSKTITIREIPYSTTTESLIQSIEAAAQKGKLKVSSIEDRTAEEVEIVLHLQRGIYADEVVPQLFAYTQCQVSISSSLIMIRDRRPVELTVTEVLEALTKQLLEQIRAELELELRELDDKRHFLTLEQIFIENRVYKRIENVKTADGVRRAVFKGMEQFRLFFVRDMTDEDVDRLLKIPIRRISAYDIKRFRQELEEIVKAITRCKGKLRSLTRTTITYLGDLLAKYGKLYPRRTEITSFELVSKREVARQDVKLSFDPQSGFFGSAVKGSRHKLEVSEYDKILIVYGSGTYRIIAPPEKLFLGKKVWAIEPFVEEQGVVVTYVYRDRDKVGWAKKIHIQGFIRDKEYDLIKDKKGKVEKLWIGEPADLVHLLLAPAKRQRKTEDWYNLEDLEFCGLAARGTRLTTKPVERIKIHRSKS
ncbi:MAG: DNA topoisomerase IV subunit A [bacterium]|nr:DNA topoisomerase IV subunit A [bacterium]